MILEAKKYPNADIVWAQEEPKNMGAWTYVQPRLVTALAGTRRVTYDDCCVLCPKFVGHMKHVYVEGTLGDLHLQPQLLAIRSIIWKSRSD